MLFVCGAMDNVSVVVRHTLVQLLTPDEKRGRVSAVNSLFIGTSNELGGFESGRGGLLVRPGLLRRLRRGGHHSGGAGRGRHLARDSEIRAAGWVGDRIRPSRGREVWTMPELCKAGSLPLRLLADAVHPSLVAEPAGSTARKAAASVAA